MQDTTTDRGLPQRTPFVGPLPPRAGVPIEVLLIYVEALREWVETPETSRGRGDHSSGSGDTQPVDDTRTDTAMGFNWWQSEDLSDTGAGFQAVVDRVQAEWKARDNGSPGPHAAPKWPFSVEEAHLVMQQHLGCRAVECPRKDSARRTLISAGRMRPDTSREY